MLSDRNPSNPSNALWTSMVVVQVGPGVQKTFEEFLPLGHRGIFTASV